MPLYEYRCEECKRKFSLLVGVTKVKAKQACPRCGSRKLTKLISRISPVVRGEEFDKDFSDNDLGGDGGDLGDDEDFGGDYGEEL